MPPSKRTEKRRAQKSYQPTEQRPNTRAWAKQRQEAVLSSSGSLEAQVIVTDNQRRTRASAKAERQPEKPAQEEQKAQTVQASSKPPHKATRSSKKSNAREKSKQTTVKGRTRKAKSGQVLDKSPRPDTSNIIHDSPRTPTPSNSRLQDPRFRSSKNSIDADLPLAAQLSNSPEDLSPVLPDWTLDPTSMANVLGGNQTPANEDTQSVTDTSPREDRALSQQKLASRRITTRSTKGKDEQHKAIASLFKPSSPYLTSEMLEFVVRSAQMFINRVHDSEPGENCVDDLLTMVNSINEWRPKHRIPRMSDPEFVVDIEKSKDPSSNEAILQRTVMMSIIDRFHIVDLFAFNCEGQFAIRKEARLPVRILDDSIKMPKPDLAVFFNLLALTDSDEGAPFPPQLTTFLKPDNGFYRTFPFLFMEAKRTTNTLDPAFRANLHSASQALYNIFQWFIWLKTSCTEPSKSNNDAVAEDRRSLLDDCDEDVFFSTVRIFSIALNATDLDVRIHRAEWTADKRNLQYEFEDVISVRGYDGYRACQIVRTILLDYAQKTLFPLLKRLFARVSQRCEQLDATKERARSLKRRGRGGDGNQTPKRNRSIVSTSSTTPLNLQNSFTMTDA